jgi:hypothetical protein
VTDLASYTARIYVDLKEVTSGAYGGLSLTIATGLQTPISFADFYEADE